MILVLALVVFGPKRLPELARQLGRITREIRKLSWEFRSALELDSLNDEIHEPKKTPSMEDLGYDSSRESDTAGTDVSDKEKDSVELNEKEKDDI